MVEHAVDREPQLFMLLENDILRTLLRVLSKFSEPNPITHVYLNASDSNIQEMEIVVNVFISIYMLFTSSSKHSNNRNIRRIDKFKEVKII